MTEFTLQDKLVEEFKILLSEFKLKNADNEEVNLNIYPQHLPAKSAIRDKEHIPYTLVKFIDGEENNEEDPREVKFLFIIAIIDKDKNYQGYKDVMNIKEKIYQFLKTTKYISGCELAHPIKWQMPEDNHYPYYFMGIETNWKIPNVTPPDNMYT